MLARAVESALAQTYSPIEIIVINDGSTDPRTREVAEQFAGRITYLERVNGGVAAARNTGIEAAHGDLLALLDQDDLWLPNKLEVEVSALTAHPGVALVHSGYYLIDAQGRRTGTVRLREDEWSPLPSLLFEVPVSACTTLFPRRVLDEVGLLDPTLSGSDDWDLWLRMATHGYRFYCVGEPLAEYRVHSANASRSTDLMVQSSLGVLRKLYEQPNLPEVVLHNRRQAFAERHAWAAAVYYGEGKLQQAREHLQKAAAYSPRAVSSGRFLQSLVHARSQSPDSKTAREAVQFAMHTLDEISMPEKARRMLRANSYLVLAVHSGVRKWLLPGLLARAVMAYPGIVLNRKLWSQAARRARRLTGKAGIPGQH